MRLEYNNHPFRTKNHLSPSDFKSWPRTLTFKEALNFLDGAPNEVFFTVDPNTKEDTDCVSWTKYEDFPNSQDPLPIYVPADLKEIKKISIEITSNNGKYPIDSLQLDVENNEINPDNRRGLARYAWKFIKSQLDKHQNLDTDYHIYIYFKLENFCPECCEFFDEVEGALTAQGAENRCPICSLVL